MKIDCKALKDYNITYEDLLIIFESSQHSLTNIQFRDDICEFLNLSEENLNETLCKIRSFLADEYS